MARAFKLEWMVPGSWHTLASLLRIPGRRPWKTVLNPLVLCSSNVFSSFKQSCLRVGAFSASVQERDKKTRWLRGSFIASLYSSSLTLTTEDFKSWAIQLTLADLRSSSTLASPFGDDTSWRRAPITSFMMKNVSREANLLKSQFH